MGIIDTIGAFCPQSTGGLARLPQVSFPGPILDGASIGLSLMGPEGSDHPLLKLAEKFLLGDRTPAAISAAAG
jgi:Asp-tRNA(Asn)/Glu-tRNA(Gln) amidotransferase A subunit family amidase